MAKQQRVASNGSTVSAPTTPVPELGARSVVLSLDPEGKLGPGVRLRDLEEEVKLPELALGAEKYRILAVLGEGGMGKVYLAYDQDLKRRVALKMVKAESTTGSARFLEEAQVMAQLEHPAIVPVYEVGLTASKKLYYTMPVVRGRTLRDVVEELRRESETAVREWSLARRVQVLVQVAQAVSYAHAKGVVHRDLKPANVMLGSHGEVQVMDWGLSKVLETAGIATGDRSSTATGHAIGTPWYMSPEQAQGLEMDRGTDVWALGVMLYELLTLGRPFEGTTAEVLAAIVRDEPLPPRRRALGRDIPCELETACLMALRKRRGERFGTVAELVAALQAWLEAEADRAKRHERAEVKAGEGRARLEEYFRLGNEVKRLEREAAEVEKRFQPWQPAEEKGEVLRAQQRLAVARAGLALGEGTAVARLTEALGFEPDHGGARALLADYYWSRFEEAEAVQDERGIEVYGKLVETYHDGRYARQLAGDGLLALDSDPPGAEMWLYELVEEGFVLVPSNERRLGTTPLDPVPLEMGSYLVVVRKAGYRDLRYPVFIGRNREWTGRVRPYTEEEIGPGMIHVPAGTFIQGGDPDCRGSDLSRSEPCVEDFLIAEHPVTNQEVGSPGTELEFAL